MSAQAFRLIDDADSWPLVRWWPGTIGLAVGIWCTSLTWPSPPIPAMAPAALWSLAGRCTFSVFAGAFAAVYAACRLAGADCAHPDPRKHAIDIACASSWFPPLALFWSQQSPWAAAVSVGLATAGTRALLTGVAAVPRGESTRLAAAGLAAAVELGTATAAAGDWRMAAAALALAAGLLTWLLCAAAVWPRRTARRGRFLRAVPGFALAVTFSAGGLTPYLARGEGAGTFGALLRGLFSGGDAGGTESEQAREPAPGVHRPERFVARTVDIGDVYPAVILWPDVRTYATLVAPRPGLHGSSTLFRSSDGTVPFSGFYSFRRPTVLPARHTHVTHGDPDKLGFRTTDSSPLIMEAHQDFGRPLDVRCCREVRVLLEVADPRPATLKLILILSDTQAPGRPEASYGPEPVSESVAFPLRADSALRQFDHATVRFRLGVPRWDQSAKAAIRQFVFVPR